MFPWRISRENSMSIPVGAVSNVVCVFLGGVAGGLLSKRLPQRVKETLSNLFGFAAMAIGINLLTRTRNLGAVVLALIMGTAIGCLFCLTEHLDSSINRINTRLLGRFSSNGFDVNQFSTLVVLFAFGATGVTGVLMEASAGDSSVLLAKSVLDFFTAMIFASKMGLSVSLIAIPQMMVYAVCFCFAGLLTTFLQNEVYGDFQAVGGIINLIVAFRILGLSKVKPFDCILGLVFIIPLSNLWQILF